LPRAKRAGGRSVEQRDDALDEFGALDAGELYAAGPKPRETPSRKITPPLSKPRNMKSGA